MKETPFDILMIVIVIALLSFYYYHLVRLIIEYVY